MANKSAFHRLPWQQGVWSRLQQARRQDRLPHAMLFAGPEGVGKENFAVALAQSLLCTDPDAQGEPCGECRHCHLLYTGNHPDFQMISPEEGGKSSEIKIDMIRRLTNGANLTAQSGGYKVIIVKPAERMNKAAANSLLKTLEEPVARTLLMLLSDHPSRLLPTIRSRCQRFAFPHPEQDAAIQWLESQACSGDAGTLLHLAGGAPLKALGMDSAETLGRRLEMLKAFIELGQDQRDPVKIVAEWSKHDTRQLMEWLTGWIIDMLRLQVSNQPPLLYNWDQKQALQRIAQQLNSELLQRFLIQVYEVRNLTESNLNPQLMLEKLLIDWQACLQRASH